MRENAELGLRALRHRSGQASPPWRLAAEARSFYSLGGPYSFQTRRLQYGQLVDWKARRVSGDESPGLTSMWSGLVIAGLSFRIWSRMSPLYCPKVRRAISAKVSPDRTTTVSVTLLGVTGSTRHDFRVSSAVSLREGVSPEVATVRREPSADAIALRAEAGGFVLLCQIRSIPLGEEDEDMSTTPAVIEAAMLAATGAQRLSRILGCPAIGQNGCCGNGWSRVMRDRRWFLQTSYVQVRNDFFHHLGINLFAAHRRNPARAH